MKKITQLILGGGLALASFATAHAAFPLTWDYVPRTAYDYSGSDRWAGVWHSSGKYKINNNMWQVENSCSSVTLNGWHVPPQTQTIIYDADFKHWTVHYDIIPEFMSSGNPLYRTDKPATPFTKGYPNITYYPPSDYRVYQAASRSIKSNWSIGCNSSDWANNCFNAIYEIRLAQYYNNGAQIPGTSYILQIEMLQSKLGAHADPMWKSSELWWTTGETLTTFGNTKVYKFICENASVGADTSRDFINIDLAKFMQHSAFYKTNPDANGATYPLASPDARPYEIHAGVEINRGSTGGSGVWSKVWNDNFSCQAAW